MKHYIRKIEYIKRFNTIKEARATCTEMNKSKLNNNERYEVYSVYGDDDEETGWD